MATQMTARLLSANPVVGVAEAFLAPAACAHLIDLAQGRLRRAKVGSDTDELATDDQRTNSNAYLSPTEDSIVGDLMQRMSDLVGLPAAHGEGLAVLHYGPGQEFTPHVDGIWSGASDAARAAFEADGGQRLFTAILYLNDVAEGGATSFPKLGLRIPPKPGRLLIFANTLAGSSDAAAQAIHTGEAVIEGEKWAAVSWWRERPYG